MDAETRGARKSAGALTLCQNGGIKDVVGKGGMEGEEGQRQKRKEKEEMDP